MCVYTYIYIHTQTWHIASGASISNHDHQKALWTIASGPAGLDGPLRLCLRALRALRAPRARRAPAGPLRVYELRGPGLVKDLGRCCPHCDVIKDDNQHKPSYIEANQAKPGDVTNFGDITCLKRIHTSIVVTSTVTPVKGRSGHRPNKSVQDYKMEGEDGTRTRATVAAACQTFEGTAQRRPGRSTSRPAGHWCQGCRPLARRRSPTLPRRFAFHLTRQACEVLRLWQSRTVR